MAKKAKGSHRRIILEGEASVIDDLVQRALLSRKVIIVADTNVHIDQLRPQQFINYFRIYDRLACYLGGQEIAGMKIEGGVRLAVCFVQDQIHVCEMTLDKLQTLVQPSLAAFARAIIFDDQEKMKIVKSYDEGKALMSGWDWRATLPERK